MFYWGCVLLTRKVSLLVTQGLPEIELCYFSRRLDLEHCSVVWLWFTPSRGLPPHQPW